MRGKSVVERARANGKFVVEPIEQRFRDRYYVAENGCWIWIGARTGPGDKGYGRIALPGNKRMLAHRWAYETFVGPIPEGLQIDHLCRNRPCVNPAHLEPVTNRENVLRADCPNIERHRSDLCQYGHPYDKVSKRLRREQRYCSICQRQAVLRYEAKKRARRG